MALYVLALLLMQSASAQTTSEFVFEKSSAPFASCHASTICETEPGSFLCAYFAGSDEGNPDVGIWLSAGKQQADHRIAWQPPVKVHQDRRHPCWNPVLWYDAALKQTVLFFKVGKSPREWNGMIRRSTDLGKTWSSAEILPAGTIGPVRAKPILLGDTLVCGSSVETDFAWTSWIETTRDLGKTWQRFGPLAVPGKPMGVIQPTLFQAGDQKLVALMRSRGMGRIVRSESTDQGRTWSPGQLTNLENPGAGIDCLRLRSGHLLLIHNPSTIARSPIRLSWSTGDGINWHTWLDLDAELAAEFSYPALIQASDGRIHATYTWKRQRVKHVSLAPPKQFSWDGTKTITSP